MSTIGPLGSDPTERRELSIQFLTKLVGLHDRGLSKPLPLACDASAAWAAADRNGKDPRAAAAREWEGSMFSSAEGAEPDHRLALGVIMSMEAMLVPPAGADETGPGWAEDEPSQFGRLARYLWDDLLSLERLT